MAVQEPVGPGIPKIALLGAGIFVRSQYIPRLKDIAHLMVFKAIWSRTEESARTVADHACDFSPNVECKWGEAGLDEIINDNSIQGVIIVLAGQVQVAGSEITSVSAISRHIDLTLPPPDHISALFQLENGCAGIFIMSVSSTLPKICWRVVGSKGIVQTERGIKDGQHGYTVKQKLVVQICWRVVGSKGIVQTERGIKDGQHGYTVTFHPANGQSQSLFYLFSGVNEELKCYIHDISQTISKDEAGCEPEACSSYLEGARDVAVLEAILESGKKQGAQRQVKRL